jgi:hypothetical protein
VKCRFDRRQFHEELRDSQPRFQRDLAPGWPTEFTMAAVAMTLSGGLDVGRRNLAWRVMRANWLITRTAGITERKNARVSTRLGSAFLTEL